MSRKPCQNEEIREDEFVQSLRRAAPSLPPALRSRTLNRCAALRHLKRQKQRRSSWRLVFALVAVLAVHGVVSRSLEIQQKTLVAGNIEPHSTRYVTATKSTPFTTSLNPTNTSTLIVSLEDRQQALRAWEPG